MKLNLGCGGKKLDGYINVDAYAEAQPDVVLDIGCERFPWADNSVETVQAWHILEHLLPAQFAHCLKETYRVCKPGAMLGVIVPHPRHDVFISDPTHVHAITPEGMALYSKARAAHLVAQGVKDATTYAPYLGVDFEMQHPVHSILDPRITPDDDWAAMERSQNNVVVEYRFTMKVIK